MESPQEFLHAKFDKLVTLGSESLHLKGKFLYCSPYEWLEKVDWDLIDQLCQTLTEWVQKWIPEKPDPESIKSYAISALYSCPSSWREKSTEDPNAYAKLAVFAKIQHFMFEVDEMTEGESGNGSHSRFVQNVGRMAAKILKYELETVESIQNDHLHPVIVQTSPMAATWLELLLDIAQDLKINFGVTKESAHYSAKIVGQIFTMQTWCGVKDQSNLLNPYTQYNLRWHTGAMASLIELSFMIEGIHVPRNVRENEYWIRCFHIAGFLPLRTNDIIGIEREFKLQRKNGKRADNVVFHFKDATNCTFEEALFRAIVEHNLALKELHDLLQFTENSPKDVMYGLNEEEREIFASTTEIAVGCMAYATQLQFLMSRYNSGLQITLEKTSKIYGLEPNDFIKTRQSQFG